MTEDLLIGVQKVGDQLVCWKHSPKTSAIDEEGN